MVISSEKWTVHHLTNKEPVYLKQTLVNLKPVWFNLFYIIKTWFMIFYLKQTIPSSSTKILAKLGQNLGQHLATSERRSWSRPHLENWDVRMPYDQRLGGPLTKGEWWVWKNPLFNGDILWYIYIYIHIIFIYITKLNGIFGWYLDASETWSFWHQGSNL